MTELPPTEPAPGPQDSGQTPETPEAQAPIPEFKREPGGPPLLGLAVIFVLLVIGAGLLTFAFVYGQQDTENRAIDGTVAAVLAFTHTPTNTRPPTDTPPPSSTPAPSATATTAAPSATATTTGTAAPSATLQAPTVTRTRRPTEVPVTDTPAPPTDTPAPAVGAHGITGDLALCDPSKTTYAAKAMTNIGLIEKVCIVETISNRTANPVTYGILGVLAQNTSGGASQFQTSWRGNLIINGNCTGPAGGGGCGGSFADSGFFIDNPGNYTLTLRICYSGVDACLGNSGDWETLTGGIPIQIISWTPSP